MYTRGIKSKEPQVIEFQVPTDLTIEQFKRTCKRLAHALGYNNDSIVEHFGKDNEKGNPDQLKLLFD
tara:strand:+ start:285 stop:485 length:201 start_codon:yes stop_codon:yes gene_type:complete